MAAAATTRAADAIVRLLGRRKSPMSQRAIVTSLAPIPEAEVLRALTDLCYADRVEIRRTGLSRKRAGYEYSLAGREYNPGYLQRFAGGVLGKGEWVLPVEEHLERVRRAMVARGLHPAGAPLEPKIEDALRAQHAEALELYRRGGPEAVDEWVKGVTGGGGKRRGNPIDLITLMGAGVIAGAVQGIVEPYVTRHVYRMDRTLTRTVENGRGGNEYWAWMRNKEGGEVQGNQVWIQPLTRKAWDEYVLPALAPHYKGHKKLEYGWNDNKDYRYVGLFRSWLKPNHPMLKNSLWGETGLEYGPWDMFRGGLGMSRDEFRPNGQSARFARRVTSLDSPEAVEWVKTSDSEAGVKYDAA